MHLREIAQIFASLRESAQDCASLLNLRKIEGSGGSAYFLNFCLLRPKLVGGRSYRKFLKLLEHCTPHKKDFSLENGHLQITITDFI